MAGDMSVSTLSNQRSGLEQAQCAYIPPLIGVKLKCSDFLGGR